MDPHGSPVCPLGTDRKEEETTVWEPRLLFVPTSSLPPAAPLLQLQLDLLPFSLRVEGERDSIYRRTQEAKLFEQIVLVATISTITHFFQAYTPVFYVDRGSLGKL